MDLKFLLPKFQKFQSFGNFSVIREVEGRSTPGTPGRKTAINLRKTTIMCHPGPESTLKSTTEVIVESLSTKKNVGKSPVKQEVKLTLSKISPLTKTVLGNGQVEIVKVPVKDYAPILRPSLSNSEAIPTNDSENSGWESSFDEKHISNSVKNGKELQPKTPLFESFSLLDGKFDLQNDSVQIKYFEDKTLTNQKGAKTLKEQCIPDSPDSFKMIVNHKPNTSSGIWKNNSETENENKILKNEKHVNFDPTLTTAAI